MKHDTKLQRYLEINLILSGKLTTNTINKYGLVPYIYFQKESFEKYI